MFSDKLQLSLVNNTPIKNLIDNSQFAEGQAGFVKNGKFAWIVRDSSLEVLSIESGVKLAHYNFGKHHGARGCIITCVEEIDYLPGVCLLAVATELIASGASTGMLSLFCVQGSKIIGSMDLCEKITCCRYIPKSACQRSVLRNFHGTVAIGTDQGKLFLIDLIIPSNGHEISSLPSLESGLFQCINVYKPNSKQAEIASAHRKVTSEQQVSEKCFFSIQLEVLDDAGAILSILCMPNLYTMAVGLNDGRMILFDLVDLQPFHLAFPPNNRSPLTHMSFLEPNDDPRCAVYIWAFHTTNEGAVAVMHSLMYTSRVNGIYEDFKSCCVRLTMPLLAKDNYPVGCRSIMRTLTQDEEDIITLNVFAWTSPAAKKTTVMIFDLNQWYKEEMPSLGDWRLKLKYTAVFELQNCTSLDVIINESSVFPFNSILRPEEHFYPNSLSFDVCVLENDKFSHYRWFGLQNIALQQFNVIGPQIILEPNYYFNELLQVAILPQFSDVTYSVSTPIDQKREFLLSVALEYNFNGFLKTCAWAWADGSYLGKEKSTGIGLSTLTDWISNRAREIKEVCNNLCKPLFDFSEQRIDYGTQKQLSQCCKQLKVLSELMLIILKDYQHFIPDHIFVQLKTQSETIKMASDYQEVLQWLLNVGLLPEGQYNPDHRYQHDDDFVIVPYPYQAINSYYSTQRIKLTEEWMGEVTRQQDQESSKFLFIDAFIERECNSKKLRDIWYGVYPPRSIQALLRTLLVPDISISNKHVIFVYLFMDITNVLSEGVYSSIVRNLIKFPAVFKMNPALIKRTQAFWNLDNGRLDTAVEELISPLSHDKHLPLWQRELLISALLKQNANSLALRALRCPGNQISSDLEMLTLLSNNLLSEALKVQRASGDRRLLEKLFEKILHSPNYEHLLDLTLTEDEGAVLGDYLMRLKDTGLPNHLNIHFVFLLQRSKFLDAAQLVESFGNESNMNLEPPKQVLNAYYASMESTTRRLTSMVYKEDVHVQESPMPLSVNLIRSRCNAKNDIYQQCVQSITEAAYEHSQYIKTLPFIGSPKLGIFEYKQPTVTAYQDVSFSNELNEHGKRKQAQQSDPIIRLEDLEAPQQKKRRLNESVELKKRKSYMDMRIANLTVFKETKPSFAFTKRTSDNNTPRSTPERVKTFGNFLRTPIVQKITPSRKADEKHPSTPHSILKTRSCRGSVSPAPSRFSEHGDDNKSVKSITFAALPDSRDASFNESSMIEESFNDEPMESTAEKFFSPEKIHEEKEEVTSSQSVIEGPKVRKPIKSRSTTPDRSQGLIQRLSHEILPVPQFDVAKPYELLEPKSSDDVVEESKLDDSVVSSEDIDVRPLRVRSVLKDDSTSFGDSEDNSDSSLPDDSIFNFVRKSVLPENYGETSYSNSESIEDEQFEEEELPEHSDYNESSNEGFAYGNDVNLDDSEDSKSHEPPADKRKPTSESDVICLDSSSDEDVVQETPVVLPSFCVLDTGDIKSVPTSSAIDDIVTSPSATDIQVVNSQEDLLSELYDDIVQPDQHERIYEEANDDIESPLYEKVIPQVDEFMEDPFSLIDPAPAVIEPSSNQIERVEEVETNEAEQVEIIEVDFIEEPQDEPLDLQIMVEAAVILEVPSTSQPESEICDDEPLNLQIVEIVENQDDLPSSSTFDPVQETEVVERQDIVKTPDMPDASEVSEELSFMSATAGELNEALVMSHITFVTSDEMSAVNECETTNETPNLLDQALITDDQSMETAKDYQNDSLDDSEHLDESKNQLNVGQVLEEIQEDSKAVVTDESPIFVEEESPAVVKEESPIFVEEESPAAVVEESPPLKRKRSQSRSSSIEPSERLLRAASMPSNASSSRSTNSRSRASTEDREAPKKLRKLKALEPIEEVATPSPGMLTRRRSQLLENLEKQDTPQTPGRITRRMSHLSEDGGGSSHSTPRRTTRAASKESFSASGSEKSPDEPGQLKRQSSRRITSKRGTSVSEDDNDDAKSTKSSVRSTRSSARKITPANSAKGTPETSSPSEELSVSNRRLTRNQLQVLEKSRQLTEKLSKAQPLRATKSDLTPSTRNTKDDDSDNESVKSDSGSIVSSRASKSRKRKGGLLLKDVELSIIPEESQEESSVHSGKRGRKSKQ